MGKYLENLEANLSEQIEYELSDEVRNSERGFGVFLVIINLLCIVYFALHHLNSTGFFQESFKALEMIMLYGIMVDWIITASMEAIFGRKKLSRLFDLYGGMVFMTIALIWLLVVFPFDFTYFADILPSELQFLIAWISNGIARIILILYIVFIISGAVYSLILRILVVRVQKKGFNGSEA